MEIVLVSFLWWMISESDSIKIHKLQWCSFNIDWLIHSMPIGTNRFHNFLFLSSFQSPFTFFLFIISFSTILCHVVCFSVPLFRLSSYVHLNARQFENATGVISRTDNKIAKKVQKYHVPQTQKTRLSNNQRCPERISSSCATSGIHFVTVKDTIFIWYGNHGWHINVLVKYKWHNINTNSLQTNSQEEQNIFTRQSYQTTQRNKNVQTFNR